MKNCFRKMTALALAGIMGLTAGMVDSTAYATETAEENSMEEQVQPEAESPASDDEAQWELTEPIGSGATDDTATMGSSLQDTEVPVIVESAETENTDENGEAVSAEGTEETEIEELLKQSPNFNSWRYVDGIRIWNTSDAGSSLRSMQPSEAKSCGIDVSSHQGTIDWSQVKDNVDFVIIRCGYGNDETDQDDSQFLNNVKGCEQYGIPYGVYLYSYATDTAMALSEANHCIRLLQGTNPTLPVFLDIEDQSILNNCSTDGILLDAGTWLCAMENAGYTAGIYANKNWWENYLTANYYDDFERWVAQWSSSATYAKDFNYWQYTSSGTIAGISGNVDRDYSRFSWKDYYLDVNGTLDGTSSGWVTGYGTFDVYINGTKVADDVEDYYTAWPYGTNWEIMDIRATDGHQYEGNSSYSGTLTEDTAIGLTYSTLTYTFAVKCYLDGKAITDSTKVGTFSVYLNGDKVVSECSAYTHQNMKYGVTYEVQDIAAESGYTYSGVYSGSLSGTCTGTTTVILNFTKKACEHSWNSGVVTKSATTTSTGIRTYTCTICGETKTEVIPMITDVPKITLQPEDTTVIAGEKFGFDLIASGTGITYLWQYSKDNGSTWIDTTRTKNTYTTTATTAMNGRLFRCIVTNAAGNSVTSNAAKLTVKSAIEITDQTYVQTVNVGSLFRFSIVAKSNTGSKLSYLWQYSKTLKGWTDTTRTVNNYGTYATLGADGKYFRCKITDADGNIVYSEPALLRVLSDITITEQPVNTTVASGKRFYFTVTATGSSLTYLWQYSIDGGSTWINTTRTKNNYTTYAKTAMSGRRFRCIITDSSGNSVATDAAKLTVR